MEDEAGEAEEGEAEDETEEETEVDEADPGCGFSYKTRTRSRIRVSSRESKADPAGSAQKTHIYDENCRFHVFHRKYVCFWTTDRETHIFTTKSEVPAGSA